MSDAIDHVENDWNAFLDSLAKRHPNLHLHHLTEGEMLACVEVTIAAEMSANSTTGDI